MPRTSDRDRIIKMLAETGGSSSARIKVELDLGDDRYDALRSELIEDGTAEKYVCRGGGLRLTPSGDRQVPTEGETAKATVAKEKELYDPLVAALLKDAPESVAFDTASLRKRGKWQNPDVTQVFVDVYPWLRRLRVAITTFEVKPWGVYDVNAVFEAASHARFAHQGFVVLEWCEKEFSLSDARLEMLVRECRRFGVGILTLERHYSHWRVHPRLDAAPFTEPHDADVEEWLDYALTRREDARGTFERLMTESERKLGRK